MAHLDCETTFDPLETDLQLIDRGLHHHNLAQLGEELVDAKTLSRQRYTHYGAGYVTSPTHAQGADLDRLLEVAQPQPTWLVLDIATGGGHTALKFAPHVARVIATDLTFRMLIRAEEFIRGQAVTNVTFCGADAEALPFAGATFDLVTCRIAPHHFPDVPRFLQEAARVLKPGRRLVLQDHVLPEEEEAARYVDAFERLRDPSHHRAYTEREWCRMFRVAGLSVSHTEEIVKQHAFLAWAERQGCTPEVIARLTELLRQAPAAAAAWMQPLDVGAPDASFLGHHIIIAGERT